MAETKSNVSKEGRSILNRSYNRRDVLRGIAIGLSGAALTAFLEACGAKSNQDVTPVTKTPTPDTPAVTKTPEPTPEPTPTQTPLEKAIAEQKLELKNEVDWQNYFVPITREEADEMLKSSNKNLESEQQRKFLLSFDPRPSPNLSIEFTKYRTNPNRPEVPYVAFNNLADGTLIYAPLSGKGKLSRVTGGPNGEKLAYSQVISAEVNYTMVTHREATEPQFPYSESIDDTRDVITGDPLIKIAASLPISWYDNKQNQAMIVSAKIQDKSVNFTSMQQFLTKNGKIAFIGPVQGK